MKFKIGDLVTVFLNKAILWEGEAHKLQMKNICPCKILAKYGNNSYKVDLPNNIDLSPILNALYLVA